MTHFFTPQSDRQSLSNAPVVNFSLQHSAVNTKPIAPEIAAKPIAQSDLPLIQLKLAIGSANDAYEQEADRVADQIVGRIPSNLSTQPLESHNHCSGQPLPAPVRSPMEEAFGADFSTVRVHTNPQAAQMSQSIQAQAFTAGTNIFFRQGAFDPASRSGQRLLAHELTHVVQQRSSAIQHRSVPFIQRKAYLANSDDAIYADTNTVGLELSYLDKRTIASKEYPLFIEYDRVEPLKTEVATAYQNAIDNQVISPQTPLLSFAQQYMEMLQLNDLSDRLGTIRIEQADGTLQVTTLNLLSFRKVAAQVALYGPLVRRTGGGSRLPRAQGKLFARTATQDQTYDFLGIPVNDRGKYSNVEFHRLFKSYSAALEYYREQGANLIILGDDLFYVSEVTVQRSHNARFQAAGRYYDQTFSTVVSPSPQKTALDTAYGQLAAPALQNWQSGQDLTTTSREDGQAAAMGQWNALGVAAYANRFLGTHLPLNQNWEWLHIQGAQIGGKTQAGNLVPGLFTANSAMIPFENLIKHWVKVAPSKMMARFKPTPTLSPFASNIRIEVIAQQHPNLGTITTDSPLSIDFDPLSGKVVDKMTGKFRERQFDRQAV
jgi:Domain of unknown function (DUF4157)